MKSSKTGFPRIIAAFGHSFSGLKSVFATEQAFRQDTLIFLIGGASLFFMPISYSEKLILGWSLFFILFAELANTAIETIVDRIGAEYNALSKRAKDIGSAMVLLSFVWAALCFGIILFR